ncbi:carbohydrate binding family 9 domain-containing protein [Fulvivirga sp. M361]|nr:carbohydrate binding family 9 domain-containing protein [Fulvivirga sp. M361]
MLFLYSAIATAQVELAHLTRKVYTTGSIANEEVPFMDGKLEEAIWSDSASSSWSANFVQRLPNENTPPSEQTAFKIVYDSKYLYIGIKCFDRSPGLINSRMSRRDGFNGDWIEILFDSYHDLRTAFSFTVSAAGVKGDKTISLNGAEEDIAWNPVWYVKTHINRDGWTAEMKIPLSQLRFGDSKQQVWGLQVQRRLLRNEELSVWQRVPQNSPGWVSEFGELHGLGNLKPQRQLEIQPFLVGAVNTFEKEPLNPYRKNYTKEVNLGVDGKLGVTNDLTLDFTINPDFGQVEADPAAIALDGFQLFFKEQRPFFIENKNIFDYRFSAPIIGSPYSSDNLFYSRRIGRSPQGQVSGTPGEYINAPQRTSILGAVKFSGKTKKGLSIGILESITSTEYAEISGDNGTRIQLVEPLTNYFVGRVQKDFNNKNTFLGGIITSTHRDLNENVGFLHESALTGGLDLTHQWSDRTWYLTANLVMSQVKGSARAIQRTQTSIPHLFQREGASHLTLDTTRTVLTGTGGDIKFGKAGKGHIKFESGLTWRSPGLELNDIGFMREADVIQHYSGITYSSVNSFGVFRNASIGYKHWFNWDFGGNLNYIDWDIELNGTFRNNWAGTFGVFSQPHIYAKSLLQGGPRIYLPDQYGTWWAVNSDSRKKLYLSYNGWTKTGGEGSYYLLENNIAITYQPVDRLNISLSPGYTTIRHRLQYNESQEYQGSMRHITSMIDQETFNLALRLNFTINANLVIQYYGEPFITTGRYDDFNYVSNATASNEESRLHFFTPDQLTLPTSGTSYEVDENRDGLMDYSFSNPDFSFAQFRSNLVLRYEYKPGSEIFLVWSQGVSDTGLPRASLFQGLNEQVFDKTPENTFLVKVTYRFYR